MRLNRYLARCGIASRRGAEKVLQAGRVRLNGEVVFDPARDISSADLVEVDCQAVAFESSVYVVMNKPRGVACAVWDKFNPTVIDILAPDLRALRLYPVGRLDMDSEGLLIITNDGDFCHSLIHPSSGYDKTYEVLLNRKPDSDTLCRWREGIVLDNRLIRPRALEVMDRDPFGLWLSIVLQDGVNREIRRMAEFFSLSVHRLFRRKIGTMEMQGVQPGGYRVMDLQRLWNAIRHGGTV
ncbi:MAG: pseudouridine synthase [Dethiosulfovibrio peptidovorans]|nr:MAG: pseudouridine synthase [Dethiosulfovibrio peptidovorans]